MAQLRSQGQRNPMPTPIHRKLPFVENDGAKYL
jgi:hypothetical protein